LNQTPEAAGDFGFQKDGFAGTGGTQDFHVAKGGQLQSGERRDRRIALSDDASQLGDGLDKKDAGENRFARKMTAQKGFVATHGVFTPTAFTRIESCDKVEKTKFPAVWEASQGLLQG
jgi:hypothetical protein